MTGQAEWIQTILQRYEGPLIRYAARITGDLEQARDAVQETFLGLCQAERSAIEDHLAAWLFRVCRNRALDLRRKERRVETVEPTTASTVPSPEPGPRAVAERREDTSQVLAVLATLPDNQREVVYLRFQNGLSYREISAITGHSVSHVGVLIHTAVRTIRAQLSAESGRAAVRAGGVK